MNSYVRIQTVIMPIALAARMILVVNGRKEMMKKWSEEELIASGYKIETAQITNANLPTENY